MSKECQSNYWFNSKTDDFYVLTEWVCHRTEKDLLVFCVACKDFIECKKKDLFVNLLKQNKDLPHNNEK